MLTVICDGCGKKELLSTTEKNRDIKTTLMSVVIDSRESIPQGIDKYEADLCSVCRNLLIGTYFNLNDSEVILEIPSFLVKHTEAEWPHDG